MLAKSKPTLLRVRIQNAFFRKLNTKLKLVYDTVQNGVPTTVTRTEPITLTAGVNTLYLPADDFILPGGTQFRASVTVDPDNEIDEVHESNNTASTVVPVKDTGSLGVLYMPLKLASDTVGPTCEDVRWTRETAETFCTGAPLPGGRSA